MSDAVVVLHPIHREALLPFLDLDEDSEDSNGIYAEELEDGSFLLYTFQPYAVFAENLGEAHAWLAQLGAGAGADLALLHDDPRGVMFFPDTLEPDAQTYDAVVAEVAAEGMFVPVAPSALAGAVAGIDPQLLQALAEQLLGGGGGDGTSAGGGGAPLPFDIGKMISGFQGQILESLRAQAESADDDEAAADANAIVMKPPSSEPKPKPKP
jgi:hypothetical protein